MRLRILNDVLQCLGWFFFSMLFMLQINTTAFFHLIAVIQNIFWNSRTVDSANKQCHLLSTFSPTWFMCFLISYTAILNICNVHEWIVKNILQRTHSSQLNELMVIFAEQQVDKEYYIKGNYYFMVSVYRI